MLLPLNWLKQYVDVNETPEQVVERFISLGFECELRSADIIDLEVTPNRGDVLSIIGLAREYGASTNQNLRFPKTLTQAHTETLTQFIIKAEPKAYHRITATIVRDIKITEHPDWLKKAVTEAGMNSIDPVVDLTNYVMLELGIPMHAFDLDALPSNQFSIRLSRAGERFISLKDEQFDLPADSIVVESGNLIVDLLGIRGGKSSMIRPETKNILVWAVSVPRPLIRQTSKKLNIRTEGSYRHERETDWQMVPVAVDRFLYLLEQISKATVSEIADLKSSEQPKKIIGLNTDKINRLLGTQLTDDEIKSRLINLGFEVLDNNVHVPSWRYFDINCLEDLAEEVGRLYGYNKLERRLIKPNSKVTGTAYARAESIKDQLSQAGFTEVYTESFAGKAEVEINGWDKNNLATLTNPVNRDFAFCRPEITPNLVKLLALNSWSDDAKIFELGHAFPAQELEENHLAMAAYGKEQKLFEQFMPAKAIKLITPDSPLAKLFKLRRPITVAEVNLNELNITQSDEFVTPRDKPAYRPVSAFPPAARDISIIVKNQTQPEDIREAIYSIGGDSIVLVELFDQFQSDKFGTNKQSLAFHIIYQSMNKTLDTETVDQLHNKITAHITQTFNAEVR